MKIKNSLIPLVGFAFAAVSSHGQTINLFSSSGDESVFGGSTDTKTSPIPDPLSGSGWGVTSSSGLDGDALRIWNTGSGRAQIHYTASTPFSAGVEINFDGLIESDAAGQYLFRMGAAGGNWAALSQSALEIRFNDAGNLRVRVNTGQTFDDTNVGLDTRFSVSLLLNPAELGGSNFDYDKFGTTGSLDPQTYSVFVNESMVGTYDMLNASSDIGGFLLLTGTGSGQAVPTMQIDNLQIVAVPEPQTYALLAGMIGLGLVMLRRRRA